MPDMQAIEEILALTDEVEARVAGGDWAGAGALDARRCALLTALFVDPVSGGTLAAHRSLLQDLLLRNQRTLQQVRLCQEQLTRASSALTRAHGALRAYARGGAADNSPSLHDSRMASP